MYTADRIDRRYTSLVSEKQRRRACSPIFRSLSYRESFRYYIIARDITTYEVLLIFQIFIDASIMDEKKFAQLSNAINFPFTSTIRKISMCIHFLMYNLLSTSDFILTPQNHAGIFLARTVGDN